MITTEYIEKLIEYSEGLSYVKDMLTPRINPTERVVESVPIEACIAEYELIKIKKSNCTVKQRKYITERVEKHFANQK